MQVILTTSPNRATLSAYPTARNAFTFQMNGEKIRKHALTAPSKIARSQSRNKTGSPHAQAQERPAKTSTWSLPRPRPRPTSHLKLSDPASSRSTMKSPSMKTQARRSLKSHSPPRTIMTDDTVQEPSSTTMPPMTTTPRLTRPTTKTDTSRLFQTTS
jgi:hypothetical protein